MSTNCHFSPVAKRLRSPSFSFVERCSSSPPVDWRHFVSHRRFRSLKNNRSHQEFLWPIELLGSRDEERRVFDEKIITSFDQDANLLLDVFQAFLIGLKFQIAVEFLSDPLFSRSQNSAINQREDKETIVVHQAQIGFPSLSLYLMGTPTCSSAFL